ncbi:MAG TPA: dicarboxylate--CoA ligase PimA [Microvirga sp.]|jgi:long-chain acyl-CoA synthetase|nr:dicarboxylate--CoA ligase PimA [Microvirga sp.]
MSRPRPWERSYPPGVRWDAPIVPSTLPALLDKAVAAHGPRVAIEFRGRTISFDALGETVARTAAALLRDGIGSGTPLALYLPNTPYHPYAFFGGAKAGARLAHLSPLDAERELAHKLKDSGARVLVTTNIGQMLPMAVKLLDAGLVDRVIVGEDEAWGPSAAPTTPIPDRPEVTRFADFIAGAEPPAAWPAVSPEDIALLQYTGGTTGLPKGAILTHGNLTAAVESYEAWFEGQDLSQPGADRVICVLPLFHIYALTTILLRCIRNGNEILLRMRFDVETTLRDIEVGRATAFPGVPTMWIALTNHPGIETRDLSSLIYCGSGGAPIPVEVVQRFERLTGHRLGGGWGMTETSPAGTNQPRHGPVKAGSIGLPLPGVELGVVSLDDPTRALGAGETGELRVRGLNVTQGYWNRPEETASAFADGWFLTGDIGFMDEDGYFYIVDRKKDMIISGGFNVYPQTIEQAIYEHPAVAECVVVGIPDEYRGEAAKAFVTLREGAAPFTLDELKAFLADKVGRHEMPTELEIRDALPRTPVGKLSKVELRDAERRRFDARNRRSA